MRIQLAHVALLVDRIWMHGSPWCCLHPIACMHSYLLNIVQNEALLIYTNNSNLYITHIHRLNIMTAGWISQSQIFDGEYLPTPS